MTTTPLLLASQIGNLNENGDSNLLTCTQKKLFEENPDLTANTTIA
jgi:hypothetical protein